MFTTCLSLALTLPLGSFLLCTLISEKYSWVVTFSSPLLLLISTLCAGLVSYWVWNHEPFVISYTWFTLSGYTFTFGILLNNLSALMLMLVTLISFLVNFYSTGYMAGDPAIKRYFAMLGFFTFSMLGIIVADNLLMVFVFWELVGFSSYALIGHWNEKPAAAGAAKRAFIINRIGDCGFLIGLMILWTSTGSFAITDAGPSAEIFSWQTVASLCIFCGVAGKSAQFPLFTWLPDAMEGPTPVSALIHAATMVAAGVFLLARIHFLFTPYSLDIVAVTGCLTALIGALAALAQYDIKKILAYSTISQLGFMVMVVGAGAPAAAILHLFTHAFFKACLFLAAGSVIHSLHQAQHQSHTEFDVQDIRNLGGLRKKLPFTFTVFVLSGCALAGLPFFTGFLSKDAILTSLMAWKGDTWNWRYLVFVSAFIVSFITVLYTFRLIWNIFTGEEKSTRQLHVLESPFAMRAPMAVLAMASVWILVSWNPFDFSGWLFGSLTQGKYLHSAGISIVSAVWVIIALVAAYLTRRIPIQSRLLLNGFYVDKVLRMAEMQLRQAGEFTANADKKWIDGLLHISAYLQLMIAHITGWFDRAIVDGVVDGASGFVRGVGSFTRSFQSGKIQLYIFWTAFTVIIFIIWTLL